MKHVHWVAATPVLCIDTMKISSPYNNQSLVPYTFGILELNNIETKIERIHFILFYFLLLSNY